MVPSIRIMGGSNVIRVLFVDDEASVLSGLRRQLFGQRSVWEMRFAVGGTAALAELEQQAFDVVVTDMRMPDVDGAAVLKTVAHSSASTGRVLLSGYSEAELLARGMEYADVVLHKPCDPTELCAAIEVAAAKRRPA
jgi:DNA-binding NarL/FixJ family response regulator